ncbi:MAG TPA: hypothetical protein PK573_09365 [Spirochaetota bacterium]|nr:hypothetical protein [Spirochaetota bacterium]HRZ28735.1 hypothetical protein [Spirochaetota bacterium]
MAEYVSVIFCRRCGSRYVEISEWNQGGKGTALMHCRTCGNSEGTANFTLGRAKITRAELENARTSAARKGRYEK